MVPCWKSYNLSEEFPHPEDPCDAVAYRGPTSDGLVANEDNTGGAGVLSISLLRFLAPALHAVRSITV